MKLPRFRPNPKANDTDDAQVEITIHLHAEEILGRDVSALTETFQLSNDDACRSFLRAIRSRLRLVLEDDATALFAGGSPSFALCQYLRSVHQYLPIWPWLLSPDDPWTLLLALSNVEGSVWAVNDRTRRWNCAYPRTRLYGFLETSRSRLATAARAVGLDDPEWRSASIALAERLLPHAADAWRIRLP